MRREKKGNIGNPTGIIKTVVAFRQILAISNYMSSIVIGVVTEAMIEMNVVSGVETG